MRFRLVRQLEGMDCGPACICMIAEHYGRRFFLKTIKAHCNITRLGITVKDVVTGCEAIGLKTVPVQIYPDEIETIPLPAILYWRQNHYVVLYRIEKKRTSRTFYIADPGYQKIRLTEENFNDEWRVKEDAGIVILTEPTDAFYELASEKKYLGKEIRRYRELIKEALSPFRKRFFWIILFSLLAAFASWATPFLFQYAIDRGIGSGNMHAVVVFMLAQFGFFLGFFVAGGIANIMLTKVGFNLGISFLSQYLHKLIRLPISFFDTKLNTDLIQRMDDQRKIDNLLTNSLNSVLLSIINFFVFSGILLYYNFYIFSVFILFSVITIFYTRRILNKMQILNYAKFTASAESKNVVYELINGMKEIKINGAQHARVSIWQAIQNKLNSISLKTLYASYMYSSGVAFINKLSDIIIVIGCAYFVIEGRMTLGIMMTITYILGQLTSSTSTILNFIRTAQDSKLSMDRLDDIYQRQDEDNSQKIPPADRIFTGFQLINASFKYEGSFNPYVLHDINLDIPVGKVTAIVGASGSGKTTLMKLLLSFYYPQKGDIYLDRNKMCNMNADQWRKKCGVVMQDGYIFSGTIAENIAIADEVPDLERVREAARIACIDQFIEKIPMSYNTKIGKSGVGLSGGQQQRIFIARAVYKNPDFIFFDEATSSLDANNEREIMQNLGRFYEGKTVVIIAHRLSTVSNADNIVFMDNGRIIEQGIHQELSQRKGAYYRLIKNQLELGK